MQTILVIMGSPRKGNTYKAVRRIEELMSAMGAVTFEYLWLKDVNYGQCRGCHICITHGEQKCPLKDDLLAVEARLAAADGIIIATPVYSQQVSYLVKIMIDRYSYMWHRPRLFGKFVLGVATGSGQFNSTLAYLKECVEAWGCTWVAGLGVPHVEALAPKMRARIEKETVKTARRFFQALQERRSPAPSLPRLLWFRMWRINARACRESNPTDFHYWTEKGWFEQDYYTGEPVSAVKRLAANLIEPLIVRVMRSMYVRY